MRRIPFFGMKVPIPNHPVLRLVMGLLLIFCGFLGFLPILGFWMIPLGLVVLSIDFPMVRRFRRRTTVKLGLWATRQYPKLAKTIGYGILRPSRN
jgi:purine-cytosine permease-like protein